MQEGSHQLGVVVHGMFGNFPLSSDSLFMGLQSAGLITNNAIYFSLFLLLNSRVTFDFLTVA